MNLSAGLRENSVVDSFSDVRWNIGPCIYIEMFGKSPNFGNHPRPFNYGLKSIKICKTSEVSPAKLSFFKVTKLIAHYIVVEDQFAAIILFTV